MRSSLALARTISLTAVVASAGCLRSTQFNCESNAQCGASGACEPGFGLCSLADPSCDSLRRFSDSAGAHANACVPLEGPPPLDSASDGQTDGSIDAPPTPSECPSNYFTLPNTPTNHRYRLIGTNAAWQDGQNACTAAAPGKAYLAIPDDAAEMTAHTTAFGIDHWIGIHDRTTEGTFVNVKDQPQAFLPFDTANGEPDDDMGGQDCVIALATGDLIATEKCDRGYPYLCECEQ